MSDSTTLPRNLLLRSNGIYYTRVMINGRDKWRSTGHTTLKSAIRKAEEIRVKLRNEEDFEDAEVPTFSAYVTRTYLPTYSVKKKFGWRDEKKLGPALKFFGRKPLDQVVKSHCVRFLNERLVGRNPASVQVERNLVQAVFERAVEDGLIERNPWKGVARDKFDPRVRLLTLENEAKLRAVLKPEYQRWLTFMLGTGLRIDEARHVLYRDVDFDRELIRVNEKWAKGGKGREVPLRPEVATALREQYQARGLLWPWTQPLFRKLLIKAAEKAGIPHLSPHDLRHTFATRYLQGGGDIYILSKILGHGSVKMTEKTYVHLLGGDLVERSRHVQLAMAG